ncbi:MAG: hypothetical protein M3457_15890 [Chloroflexota bacterium]|nr:hypothetical protein [Chloroflexota bacterium]
MATYIVAFDLNREINRPRIIDAIREQFDSRAKLNESSYAISTSLDPEAVRDGLLEVIDDRDNLYVIPLANPWSGLGPVAVTDWLLREIT